MFFMGFMRFAWRILSEKTFMVAAFHWRYHARKKQRDPKECCQAIVLPGSMVCGEHPPADRIRGSRHLQVWVWVWWDDCR